MSKNQKKELQDALKGMRLSKKESEAIKGGVAMSMAEASMASMDARAISSVDLAAERVSLNTAVQVDTGICLWSSSCYQGCFNGGCVKCVSNCLSSNF